MSILVLRPHTPAHAAPTSSGPWPRPSQDAPTGNGDRPGTGLYHAGQADLAYRFACHAVTLAEHANQRAEAADARAGYATAVALLALLISALVVIGAWTT